MRAHFLSTILITKSRTGREDELLSSLVFQRADGELVMAPVGGTTDGLSVPICLQWIIPAGGGDWFSGVLHDSAYRNQMMTFCEDAGHPIITDGFYVGAAYSRKDADDLMLEALKAQGAGFCKRWIIYLALRCFGGPAFKRGHRI